MSKWLSGLSVKGDYSPRVDFRGIGDPGGNFPEDIIRKIFDRNMQDLVKITTFAIHHSKNWGLIPPPLNNDF